MDLQILFPVFLMEHLSWLGEFLELESSEQALSKHKPTFRHTSPPAVSKTPLFDTRYHQNFTWNVDTYGPTFQQSPSSPTSAERSKQEVDVLDPLNLKCSRYQ